ncbi:ABC transporter ATP-binding protein [Streptomyces endophyticus]|uniref:ABC transporter ATP-binding protein n=1 Tax=Streptomyces endophyticus TaxID=714166 RepID=A0ABU6FD65_9ACTN|nr:ABC transporter ATP-binding protein [Streptomyces endophyticus]MEB8341975.1 ABC transporter ATP-binding protein [Streptomyces endophyticus]
MTPPPTPPLLDVRGLSVDFPVPDGRTVHAVRDVSFTLRRGETLAVVGESGSGKSTTALALTRMLPGAGRITAGSVRLDGTELTTAGEQELRAVRGARIGMVFQDPMTSLNPVLSVRAQLDDVLRAHGGGNRAARRARAEELLGLVGVPNPRRRLDDHPHQFSGGQRQRVLIAMALANEPDVLLADEPTTALDATVQEQILSLVTRLNEETGTALVLITHNMGVVARTCERVLVMYGGSVVEDGPTARVLTRPRHPYTGGLLAAVPRLSSPSGTRLTGIPGAPPDLSLPLAGCAFAARCGFADAECGTGRPVLGDSEGGHLVACRHPDEVAADGSQRHGAPPRTPLLNLPQTPSGGTPCRGLNGPPAAGDLNGLDEGPDGAPVLAASGLRKEFRGRRPFVAVDGVSLRLHEGETLGLVGESGSGKSTLARLLAHAHPADAGTIALRGEDVTRPSREVQLVFQDPYASLNPRMTVGDIIGEPLLVHGLQPERTARRARVAELLELVGLDAAAADRLPRAFSGGQRQRIGIARALAPEPSVLICDEPVSALDVSVQAQIVNLLSDLQGDLGLALLFIAHDLAVVRQVSHRVAVMHRGRIVETGPADEVCERPQDPYTQALLAAAPDPVPAAAPSVHAA